MSALAYYPGCSSHASSREYELSCRALFPYLGLAPVEVTDWSCCGASAAHGVSDELAVALPLRNLAIAEAMAATAIMTPCAACYDRLRHAAAAVAGNAPLKARMTELVGVAFRGTVAVHHLVDLLHDQVGADRIRARTTRSLAGLKVACYYGCLLVRPPGGAVVDQRPEDPCAMDELAAAVGAEPVSWPHKTECCGAAAVIPHPESVVRLVGRLAGAARLAGAHCLVAACPLCHGNLDMRQEEAVRQGQLAAPLPVLYLSQLLGLAVGLAPEVLGLGLHFVDTAPVLAAIS
ncbi:MAG: CoB--CoM heterodisulfide reductase iron-sulfur subunit B family protein [Thermodesulfobacteriota bacterium]